MENEFELVRVEIAIKDLSHLCTLAIEAGQDLQAFAEVEYRGDNPSNVRKRQRDQAWAQKLIDLATMLHPNLPTPLPHDTPKP
jgi:hypothetical protein